MAGKWDPCGNAGYSGADTLTTTPEMAMLTLQS
jgi:hypothetical protein